MNKQIWSVPGNLLIAGEYFVTEINGRGIAVAGGSRATLEISENPEGNLKVISRSAGKNILWESNTPVKKKACSVCDFLLEKINRDTKDGPPRLQLEINTSDFFFKNGNKKGLGSSAAAAILFSKGFFPDLGNNRIIKKALKAHTVIQGKKGSGYDVVISTHGGCGIYTNTGENPKLERTTWPEIPEYYILSNPKPVKTSKALNNYNIWKKDNTKLFTELKHTYNTELKNLENLLRNATVNIYVFIEIIKNLSKLSCELGKHINVPAEPYNGEYPELNEILLNNRSCCAVKSLGAGNETVLIAAEPGSFSKKEKSAIEQLIKTEKIFELKVDMQGLNNDNRN
jgi:phosphomevalonate kinase